jgi:hypothetical protein
MAYTIWEESRDEEFGDGNTVITRIFRVEPYSSRGDFVADLLGSVRFFGDEIVRYPPARDPWFPFCWCVSAKVRHIEVLNSPENVASGSAAAIQKNSAASGRVVAVYKSLDRDLAPPGVGPGGPGNSNENTEKELASEEWDYSNVQFTLPNAFWKWADDEALIKRDTPMWITLPKIDLTLVRHFCLTKPHQAILTLGGKVNKSKFGIWPPETLRFDGLHAGRRIMSRGIPYWDLTYKFAAFPHYDNVADVVPRGPGDPMPATQWVPGIKGNFKLDNVRKDFVGWNRKYRPAIGRWCYPESVGDLPGEPKHRPYLFDEDVPDQVIRNRAIKGFWQLFHPAAK